MADDPLSKKSAQAKREELILDIKDNLCELVAGFCVMSLALILLLLKMKSLTMIIIAITASGCIIMIGLEKRAKKYDRIVSMSAILLIAMGFILLG
jgi:hypothetical protein